MTVCPLSVPQVRVVNPGSRTATSTAPTIGMKRRLSSVDMDLDTSVGSLSKKSRRGTAADASDDEEPTSSPLPPRSSPPTEGVKEVTTGVKEIELDQKPDVPPSDPPEVVEPSVTLDTETFVTLDTERSVEAEEGVKTEEDATPEQRPEEEKTPEVGGLQDPVEGDPTDDNPVKPAEQSTDDLEDTTKASEEGAKSSAAHPVSPTKACQSKSTVKEPAASEDKSETKA